MIDKLRATPAFAALVLAGFLGVSLCGCSVHFELGYHGQTGRDDRTQTELVTKGVDNGKRYQGQ